MIPTLGLNVCEKYLLWASLVSRRKEAVQAVSLERTQAPASPAEHHAGGNRRARSLDGGGGRDGGPVDIDVETFLSRVLPLVTTVGWADPKQSSTLRVFTDHSLTD